MTVTRNVFYVIVEDEIPVKKSAVFSERLKWISHDKFLFFGYSLLK